MQARIGFGTARTALGSIIHERSLEKALVAGVNLIDTSSNYGDGLSEKLVAKVLKTRPNGREGVTIVSKFGYIQGQELENVKEKDPWPETSQLDDDFHHCIHPTFMADQLTNTLKRLDIETLDVYLVHNPEYFLAEALKLNADPNAFRPRAEIEEKQQELMERLARTFTALEEECRAGRIGAYGVSSCALSKLPTDPLALPYHRFLELAEAAAKRAGNAQHGFKYVQFPANLFEVTGLQGCGVWAQENGVEVLVNRPLTSIGIDGTWRLTGAVDGTDAPNDYTETKEAILAYFTPNFADAAFERVRKELSEEEQETAEACGILRDLINSLDDDMGKFTSVMHYEDNLARGVVPMLDEKFEGLDERSTMLLQVRAAYACVISYLPFDAMWSGVLHEIWGAGAPAVH
jgi:aryl-alcohol dehydrogenase-like predicted oxidoreductase